MPNVGDGPRGVVGDGLDHHRDAAGAVALVRHFLIIDALELSGALLDRALDVLFRHRARSRVLDRRSQTRVPLWITAALLGGERNLANELREQRAALRVGRCLVMLDLLPFTVTSHTPLEEQREKLLGDSGTNIAPGHTGGG